MRLGYVNRGLTRLVDRVRVKRTVVMEGSVNPQASTLPLGVRVRR